MEVIRIGLLCLCLSFSGIRAARIDSLKLESVKMNGKKVETLVIVPDCAAEGKLCPVLYLLHGYSGNEHSWLTIKPELVDMAEKDDIIVVCPNGENSWYWDSPLCADSQYETFISSELVSYIDTSYATIKSRNARAIVGLSMGGHGALWLAIRHQEVFGAAGSTSGGVDIRPFPEKWEMKKMLGNLEEDNKRWSEYTVMTQLGKLKDGQLALLIDCGIDDFFLEVNTLFHKELLRRGISHDFILRSGSHNHKYWNNSIDYQWLFIKKFFTERLED